MVMGDGVIYLNNNMFQTTLKMDLNTVNTSELKVRAFGNGLINPEERFRRLYISEIPIMITAENELLCIPVDKEVKHIGICGMTGTCKSLFLNALISWHYWHCKRICVNFNDIQRDSFEWSLGAESFLKQLEQINISPCPTPLVYIFPSTKTLEINKGDRRFPLLKMSIPIGDVIRNITNFFDLDKSEVYMKNLIDDLVECKSMNEIESVLNENIPEKHMMMKFKILNIFQSLFEDDILNVSVPEAPSFLEYSDNNGNKYYGTTISTMMRANLIPSIQTSDLCNQNYFSAYMSYILKTIYRNQYEDEYFKDKTISLFVDEIDKLWKGKNGELIKKELCLIGTNGRMARIGLIWATQNYDQVPDRIKGNTKYIIVSRQNDDQQVKKINHDWVIPKSMKEDILTLTTDRRNGKFEVIAATTEEFITYDLETGKRSKTSESKRGFLIPPMARHRVPGVQI